MANINTDQMFNATLAFTKSDGSPGVVDGVPVWSSSDATMLAVNPSADGMSCVIPAVAPPSDPTVSARITVTADADLGSGVVTITGASEDVFVTLGPSSLASMVTITLGAPVAKV